MTTASSPSCTRSSDCKRLSAEEQRQVWELTDGLGLNDLASQLLSVDDPDAIEAQAREQFNVPPTLNVEPSQREQIRAERAKTAASPIAGMLNTFLEQIRERREQVVDHTNLDTLTDSGWEQDAEARHQALIGDFEQWLQSHRDDLAALTIFYSQPHRRKELTQRLIRELLETLKRERPALAPAQVGEAYARVDDIKVSRPESELTQFIALVRRVCGWDEALTPYKNTVERNFQRWVLHKHEGNAPKFSDEQMTWLRLIRDHIASSIHFTPDDLDYTPFDAQGGRGGMWQLFGEEMNDELAA